MSGRRRNEVCPAMAVNDGGVPPILAQKHDTQPSAFTPENLLREADGGHDALQLIAIAADRLRSRLP